MPPRAGPTLAFRQEQRPLADLLQVTALLATGQADLVTAVQRGLAKNPMLARRPGSVCPACGRHRRSGRCSGCRTASPANEAEPSHAPLESVEALARRGARRGARRRGGRRPTRRDLPFWSRPAASSVFKSDVIGVELPLRPRSFRAPPGPVLADKDYFSRTNRA